MKRILGLMVMLLPMAALAQSAFNGTWKIDYNQFQLDRKPVVVELKDGMFTCSTCDPKISVKADGKDQKLTNDPGADTARVTVVDPHTAELIEKKDGKTVMRVVATASDDGKTLERKTEMTAVDGTKSSYTTILSRNGEADTTAHLSSGSWTPEKTKSAKEMTLQYAVASDGITFKGNDGEAYNVKFDGKDYPFQGMAGTTKVAVKKIDDRTIEETYKSAEGDVVFVAHISVSPDGKTLTQVGHDAHTGRSDTFVATKEGSEEAEK
jgi:hypothetical protein